MRSDQFLMEKLKSEDCCPFLKRVSSVPLQQGLRQLQTAYTNFFAKRASYPKFRSRKDVQSANFTKAGFVFWNGTLSLAKVGQGWPN